MSVQDARAAFTAILQAVAARGVRYVITDGDRPVGAVVSMDDLRRLQGTGSALPRPSVIGPRPAAAAGR